MTRLAQQSIRRLHRSEEPDGIEGSTDRSTRLGREAIRLARLATSIHLTQAARLWVEAQASRGEQP